MTGERPRTKEIWVDGVPVRHVRLFGQDDEPAEVDERAKALVLIDTVHARIHQGLMYGTNVLDVALANDGDLELLLKVGAQSAHSRIFGISGGDAQLTLFEGTTVSADGSAKVPVNRNRFSARASITTAFSAPTITGDGATLDTHLVIGGTGPSLSIGSESDFKLEWILSSNTNYLVRLTNISGAVQPVHIQVDFYEPPD